MNVSEPFILRPVATTLLMVAILLAGASAFRLLPLATLPAVDYPTIQVQTFYPGGSPEVMTRRSRRRSKCSLARCRASNQMLSASSGGASIITLQFNLDITLDVAEQEVQAAINAANNLFAGGSAGAADLRQGQSRRRADSDARGHVEDSFADRSRGFERDATRAKNFAAARRWTREHKRRSQARGAGADQPARARRLWPQHRRRAHDHRQRHRRYAERQFRRPGAGVKHQRQRPADNRR